MLILIAHRFEDDILDLVCVLIFVHHDVIVALCYLTCFVCKLEAVLRFTHKKLQRPVFDIGKIACAALRFKLLKLIRKEQSELQKR